MGQSRPSGGIYSRPGVPSIADIGRTSPDIRVVPKVDITLPASPPVSTTRRWHGGPLPDRPVVELDRETVGRINRTLVRLHEPDTPRVINPRPGRNTRIVDYVELPPVLRDVGKTTRSTGALRHASIYAVQVDPFNLRCRVGGDQSGQSGDRA